MSRRSVVTYVVNTEKDKPFLGRNQIGSIVYVKSTQKSEVFTGDDWEPISGGGGTTVKGSDTVANIITKPGVEGEMWISTTAGDDGNTPPNPVAIGDALVYNAASGVWETVGPIAGPAGPPGQNGADGSDGSDGADGATGPAGADSTVPGPAGADGNDGLPGANGTDGAKGDLGEKGDPGTPGVDGGEGPAGPNGQGVPNGGDANQVLAKVDGSDFNTIWVDQSGGGGVTVIDNLTSTSPTDALSANMGTHLLDLLETHENNDARHLSIDQNAALDAANAPDAANPVATMADISAGTPGTAWKGIWGTGSYDKGDQTTDKGWLKIANKTTTDRPSPVATKVSSYIYQGKLEDNNDVTGTHILAGQRYSFLAPYFLKAIRLFTKIDQTYQVFAVYDPLGDPIFRQLLSYKATTDGWSTFDINDVLIEGSTHIDIIAKVESAAGAATEELGDYWYYLQTGVVPTADGQIYHDPNDKTKMKIHKNNIAGHPMASFEHMTTGDTIRIKQIIWTLTAAPVDAGDYWSFDIDPELIATSGAIETVTFTQLASTDVINHNFDINYFTSNPEVEGIYELNGNYDPSGIAPDGNQYIIDIETQQVAISQDWDFQAYSAEVLWDGISVSGTSMSALNVPSPAPPANDPPAPTTGLLARYAESAMLPIPVTSQYEPFRFTSHTTVDRNNGFFDFPIVTGQPYLTVLADGVYKLRVNISVKTSKNATLFFRLFRNDGTASWQESARNYIAKSKSDTVSMTGVLELNAGDKLELRVKSSINTDMEVLAANWEIEKTKY